MPRADEDVDAAKSSHFDVLVLPFTFHPCTVLPSCTFTCRATPLPESVLENLVSIRADQICLKINGL